MLAAIGIYGVVSYTVVQRTGELGIRVALGAQRRDVMWLILGKGALLVLCGACLGGVGAYAVSKVLISLIPAVANARSNCFVRNCTCPQHRGAARLLYSGSSRNTGRSSGRATIRVKKGP
jgi:ABC-type antimicrobial peptide transport system permease subunit